MHGPSSPDYRLTRASKLQGRLLSLAPRTTAVAVLFGLLACGVDDVPDPTEARIDAIVALEGDATFGQALYTMNCTSCHDGLGGAVSDMGTQITFAVPERTDRSLLRTLLEGRACALTMPSFAELDDQELADVLAHLRATFEERSPSPPAEGCRGEPADASTSG